MLYFGVWEGQPGHYLYDRNGRLVRNWPMLGKNLDIGFCPETGGYQREGVAALEHVNGWTVLAFWDRSGDKRGSSNSVFLAEGKLTFEEMVARAQEEFPEVWERFTFNVQLAEAK